MSRPCVLSIAGFDPSAGAGILADIKTFETIGAYGFGVCTALTFQDDVTFKGVDWVSQEQIFNQLQQMGEHFEPFAVKIGLIQNLDVLKAVLNFVGNEWPESKVIWDPILKASAGFEFHKDIDKERLTELLGKVHLITPNVLEAETLGGDEWSESAKWMSGFTNVLLKGGHKEENKGVDTLYTEGEVINVFAPAVNYEKHGTGCVFSSAFTAYLALGNDLRASANKAKRYIHGFLQSNDSLLGYHMIN